MTRKTAESIRICLNCPLSTCIYDEGGPLTYLCPAQRPAGGRHWRTAPSGCVSLTRAAELTGRSTSAIKRLIDEGRLEAWRTGAAQTSPWAIPESALQEIK